ncbi:hypothetical protein OSI26_25375, partial [Mycobacterium ulcerans]
AEATTAGGPSGGAHAGGGPTGAASTAMGRGKADEIECDAAAAATARPGHPRARRTADASSAALAEGDSDIARISGTTATSGTARSAGAPVPASTADV